MLSHYLPIFLLGVCFLSIVSSFCFNLYIFKEETTYFIFYFSGNITAACSIAFVLTLHNSINPLAQEN